MSSEIKKISPLQHDIYKIALISMPWPLFNRPSIQLGALKAYLEQKADWLRVTTIHPYLEIAKIIGPQIYHWISQDLWLSEALYSYVIYPELRIPILKYIEKALRKADKNIRTAFDKEYVVTALREQLSDFGKKNNWHQYDLVGFSICFNQLLGSLAAAKYIKTVQPNLAIVFGGSSCAGEMGSSLLRNFDQIDYVIDGEGEIPLLQLCKHLTNRKPELPDNIFQKTNFATNQNSKIRAKTKKRTSQINNLKTLPIPDYREYFVQMKKWFVTEPFIPVLPIEFSRGCWWSKCTFCNLNVQWCGYRNKKHSQVINEIETLARRHSCLDFSFSDNSLPYKESNLFFQKTSDLRYDYLFFGEIKANLKSSEQRKIFSTYKKGGLTTIQVGIESLSNSLLQKMGKGTSVINNIATLKDALDNKIALEGNIITEFPGSTREEVEETLANLDFVLPFKPLSVASFFLGYGSPIFNNPENYNIQRIRPHPLTSVLFPADISNDLRLMVNYSTGNRTEQRYIWRPVILKIKKWHSFHQNRNKCSIDHPLLSYRDGGDYIIIRQELLNKKVLHHRLKNKSREIYLYCKEIRRLEEILNKFQSVSKKNLSSFLHDLVKKRLIFSENNKFLSLAIHNRI